MWLLTTHPAWNHPLSVKARDTFHAIRKQQREYHNFTLAQKREFVLDFYNPLRIIENELKDVPNTQYPVQFYVETILRVCNRDFKIVTDELSRYGHYI